MRQWGLSSGKVDQETQARRNDALNIRKCIRMQLRTDRGDFRQGSGEVRFTF